MGTLRRTPFSGDDANISVARATWAQFWFTQRHLRMRVRCAGSRSANRRRYFDRMDIGHDRRL